MTAIQMLQKLMVAQVKSNLALGAAIEELAIWAEQHGGGYAAAKARDALDGLDEATELIGNALEELGNDS